MIPFAVVGSDQEYQVNGRRLLGRKTKWGTIEGTFSSLIIFNNRSSNPVYLRKGLITKGGNKELTVFSTDFQQTVCQRSSNYLMFSWTQK